MKEHSPARKKDKHGQCLGLSHYREEKHAHRAMKTDGSSSTNAGWYQIVSFSSSMPSAVLSDDSAVLG